MTKRERVLIALATALGDAFGPLARNVAVPMVAPAAGLAVLHDGEPGKPEVTLSPLTYHYQHRAEIDVIVQDTDNADAVFDALVASLGAKLAADRTLGGLCDWAEAESPRPAEIAPEGAAPIKAAMVGVILHYATPDPLG